MSCREKMSLIQADTGTRSRLDEVYDLEEIERLDLLFEDVGQFRDRTILRR